MATIEEFAPKNPIELGQQFYPHFFLTPEEQSDVMTVIQQQTIGCDIYMFGSRVKSRLYYTQDSLTSLFLIKYQHVPPSLINFSEQIDYAMYLSSDSMPQGVIHYFSKAAKDLKELLDIAKGSIGSVDLSRASTQELRDLIQSLEARAIFSPASKHGIPETRRPDGSMKLTPRAFYPDIDIAFIVQENQQQKQVEEIRNYYVGELTGVAIDLNVFTQGEFSANLVVNEGIKVIV